MVQKYKIVKSGWSFESGSPLKVHGLWIPLILHFQLILVHHSGFAKRPFTFEIQDRPLSFQITSVAPSTLDLT